MPKSFLLIPIIIMFMNTICLADAVFTKNGREIKGVVVEEYDDRVVISTYKGEESILKEEIEEVRYDIPEENLSRLAALYKDKGEYKTALALYRKAYKLQPDFKEARDGMLLAQNLIFNKQEAYRKKQVSMRQDTERNLGAAQEESPDPRDAMQSRIKKVWETVGVEVMEDPATEQIAVKDVLEKSPADIHGIKQGDIILAIWGKLTRYMSPRDVMDLLLSEDITELRLTIMRRLNIKLAEDALLGGAKHRLGGAFEMLLEGLTVSDVKPDGPFHSAGVKNGDLVAYLDGKPTRYMSLPSAYELIEETDKDVIEIGIHRAVVLWKKRGER
ncbi:MAG: PDZ domain-containing protein [Candidatus Omnitrophota bacterium]